MRSLNSNDNTAPLTVRPKPFRAKLTSVMVLAAPIAAFLGLGIRTAATRPLWRDEFATLGFASMSPSELWSATQHVDFVLSPYYFLMRLLPGTTISEISLRSISLAAGVLTLLLIGFIGIRWWGTLGAGVGIFVLAFNPLFIELSSTARPYGLAILFVTGSIAALGQALRKGRRTFAWIAFSACIVLAGLSHLFAILGIAATITLVLPSSRRKMIAWLISAASAAIVLMPFAARAFAQQGQVAWIPDLTLRSTIGSLASLIVFEKDGELGKPQALGLLLVFSCFILAVVTSFGFGFPPNRMSHFRRHIVFATTLFVLPWAVLAIESIFFTPFLRTTYLAPSLVGLALGLGGLVHQILQSALKLHAGRRSSVQTSSRSSHMVFLSVLLLFGGTIAIPLPTSAAWLSKPWWIDDFPGIASALSEDVSKGDVLAFVQLGSESGVRLGLAASLHDKQFEVDSQRRLVQGDQPTIVLRRVVGLTPLSTVESEAPAAGSTIGLIYTRGGFRTNEIQELNTLGIRCASEASRPFASEYGLLRYKKNACHSKG